MTTAIQIHPEKMEVDRAVDGSPLIYFTSLHNDVEMGRVTVFLQNWQQVLELVTLLQQAHAGQQTAPSLPVLTGLPII